MTLHLETARNWYSDADPVHDFSHIQRVYRMATRIAIAEGADLEIVQAAALLHDVEGSAPGQDRAAERASHHLNSAEFARQILKEEGWEGTRIEAVLHCIRAHRFRSSGEKPETLEAKVLFDADKLDVLGAVGAARTVAYAALDGKPFLSPVSEQFLQTGVEAEGELHSSYHEYLFKLRKVKSGLFTQTGKKIARDRDRYLTNFYKRLLREYQGEI